MSSQDALPFKLHWHPIAVAIYSAEGLDHAALKKHLIDAGTIKPVNLTQVLTSQETDADTPPDLVAIIKAAQEEKAKVEEAAKKAAKKAKGGKKGEVEEAPLDFYFPAPGAVSAKMFRKAVDIDEPGDFEAIREQRAHLLQHTKDRVAATERVLTLAQQALDHAIFELQEVGDTTTDPATLDEAQSVENARANVAKARDALARAEAEQTADARAARMYLLEEPVPSMDRLADLRAGGVPLAAVICVKPKPPTEPAADAPSPATDAPPTVSEQIAAFVAALRERQARGDVTDPLGPVVALEITAGVNEGPFPFVPPRGKKEHAQAEYADEGAAAPPPEALQVTKAIDMLRDQTVAFEGWRAALRVHDVPDAAPVEQIDLRLYEALLKTVPESAVSVPVVLHCMLDQISRTMADEGHEGNEADAVAFAADTLGALFRGLEDGVAVGPSHAEQALSRVEVIPNGHESLFTASGLVAGFRQKSLVDPAEAIRPTPASLASLPPALQGLDKDALLEIDVNEDGSVRIELQTVTKAGWQSFMHADGSLNVDAVERHMYALAPLPSVADCGTAEPSADERESHVFAQEALAGFCEQEGTQLGLLRRAEALQGAVDVLPDRVRAAHADDLTSRRHFERLEQGVLGQVYNKAASVFPEAVHRYLPTEDAVLTVLYGGSDAIEVAGRVSCPIHFRTYLEEFLAKKTDASKLPKVAYDIDPLHAGWGDAAALLYPDDGAIVRIGATGPTVFHESQSIFGLRGTAGDYATFTATLMGGIAISVTQESAGSAEHPAAMRLQCSLPTSVVVSIDSSGQVTMTRAKPEAAAPGAAEAGELFSQQRAGRLIEKEALRAIRPTAAVISKGDKGSLRLLLPDGDVAERPAGSDVDTWRLTNQAGERWVEKRGAGGETEVSLLPALEVAKLFDADTHANVLVREDQVVIVDYPSGDRLVMDKDDTRVYLHWEDKKKAHWVVESAHLPTVSGNLKCSKMEVALAPGLDLRWSSDTGALSLVFLEQNFSLTAFDGCVGVQRVLDLSAAASESDAFISCVQGVRSDAQAVLDELADWTEARAASDAEKAEARAGGDPAPAAATDANAEDDELGPAPIPHDVALLVAQECMENYVFDLQASELAIITDEQVGFRVARDGAIMRLTKTEVEPEPSSAAPADPAALGPAAAQHGGVARAGGESERGGPVATVDEELEDLLGDEDEEGSRKEKKEPRAPTPPPPVPIAPRFEPRVFVVYPGGDGFELLSESCFRRIMNRSRAEGTVVEQHYAAPLRPESQFGGVEGSTEFHLLSKSFVQASSELEPLPIMSTAKSAIPPPPVAVPALHTPSRVVFPARAIPGTFHLPRAIAGVVRPVARRRHPVVVHRSILEQPPLREEDAAKIRTSLALFREFEEAQTRGPEQFIIPDRRSAAEIKRQRDAVARLLEERTNILNAACDDQVQGDDRRAREAKDQAARDAAQAEADRRAGLKTWAPWPPRVVPYADTPQLPVTGSTLSYFQTKEGIEAAAGNPMLKSMRTAGSRKLPPPLKGEAAAAAQRRVRPDAAADGDGEAFVDKAGVEAGLGGLETIPHGNEPSMTDLDEEDSYGGGGGVAFQENDPHAHIQPLGASGKRRLPTLSATAAAAAAEDEAPPNLRSMKFGVTGAPRTTRPPLPEAMLNISAPSVPHARHLAVEGEVFRSTNTLSGQLLKAQGRVTKAFVLQPERLDFGRIVQGRRTHLVAKLKNVSAELSRFHVVRPPPPLSVIYKHGPVAAGVDTPLTVEIAPSEVGRVEVVLEVKTETAIFYLPVTAEVVPAPHMPRGSSDAPPQPAVQVDASQGSLGSGGGGGSGGLFY